VFLGLHYPTDVIGGALLGAAVALLLWLPPVREALRRLADALADLLSTVLGALRPAASRR
jgi:membrane-associated phospholipid phosphatase